tara:strand:- start:26682 stop:26792 length:111 start_codon:yes stop_codon:yes gene_type:complete
MEIANQNRGNESGNENEGLGFLQNQQLYSLTHKQIQ